MYVGRYLVFEQIKSANSSKNNACHENTRRHNPQHRTLDTGCEPQNAVLPSAVYRAPDDSLSTITSFRSRGNTAEVQTGNLSCISQKTNSVRMGEIRRAQMVKHKGRNHRNKGVEGRAHTCTECSPDYPFADYPCRILSSNK